MAEKTHIYNVGGHCFKLQFKEYPFLLENLADNYAPFVVEDITGIDLLFQATVCKDVRTDDILNCVFSQDRSSVDCGDLKVFSTAEGLFFEQTQPYSQQPNARIRLTKNFDKAEIALRGSEQQCCFAFNHALMLCYILSTAMLDTVLTHSSCVLHGGKAYLFLGKSGTGKSTHSRLWLKHVADTTLLNDDHPILRINEQGAVVVYGSPWSGKTPCYRNESAPVGAIVRICKASHNQIQALGAAQSYASLTTSFSGMTWEPALADGRHHTIEKVIASVPCFQINCLPDKEAALICHEAVTRRVIEKEYLWRS